MEKEKGNADSLLHGKLRERLYVCFQFAKCISYSCKDAKQGRYLDCVWHAAGWQDKDSHQLVLGTAHLFPLHPQDT